MSDTTDQADVEQRVTAVVADIFGEDPASIDRDTEFVADLKAKSMDIVALLAALEGEFGLSISAADVRQNDSVGEAADWIRTRIDEQGGD